MKVWLFPKQCFVLLHFVAQRLAEPEVIALDRLSIIPVNWSSQLFSARKLLAVTASHGKDLRTI